MRLPSPAPSLSVMGVRDDLGQRHSLLRHNICSRSSGHTDGDDVSERDLSKEIAAAKALKSALEGFDDETIRDTLEGETGLHEAIAKVMGLIREDEVLIAGISEIEKSLSSRKSRLEARVERLRGAIEEGMRVGELKKLQLPEATLSLREIQPKVIVQDETQIPAEYFDPQPPKLNKKALNDAVLRDNVLVSGVTLSNKTTSLSIRRA